MRRFWLKKNNTLWDLSVSALGESNGFLADPQGLGFKAKIESFDIEYATFVEKVTMDKSVVKGNLYFRDYESFSHFLSFIGIQEKAEPIRLYYSTSDLPYASLENWYKDCLITTLGKTEIEVKSGVLKCAVEFTGITPWKQDRLYTVQGGNPVGDALVYGYLYNYTYGGASAKALDIDNTNNLPTACKIEIYGVAANPSFYLEQNGVQKQKGRFRCTLPNATGRIVIDSDPVKQEAMYYDTSVPDGRSVYNLAEPSYDYANFITIPPGLSRLIVTADGGTLGAVSVSFSIQREVI
jgi:hypothetical protein